MFKNTMKTAILLAAFGALFMAVGSYFGQGWMFVGLLIGLAFAGGSYWFSDRLAIASARAKPVSREEMPQLYEMVERLTQRADMPMPRLFISDQAQPNAFATGRNPQHAAVCVTRGLLQALDPQELEGVLAHELAHVRHRDILITSVAAACAMAITFAARMIMWGAVFAGGDRNRGNVFGMLAMMILAPIAAALIQASLSRSREFEADRGGAEMMGQGEPLARALEKIEHYANQVPMDVDPAQATAYIVNPFAGRKVDFAGMFRTHPPTADRIARLRSSDSVIS